jgi:threonine dehydrogenase-like Zn-dependent dehydrogenase
MLRPELAALAEPVAVAVHGLRLGGFQPGQRVLVLGAGTIGLATVGVARALGAGEVLLTARHKHQAERGEALGATRILTEREASVEALASLGASSPADLVVETVGGEAKTLVAAGAAVAPGGTVSVLGLFMGSAEIDPFPLLLKEVNLQWSNCYSRSPAQADFQESVQLLQACAEDWSSLLTHSVPLDQIGDAFVLAGDKSSGAVKVTVVME